MKTATPPSRVAGIRSGLATLLATLAALAVPAAAVSVGDWAARHRVVAAEAGSPHPGKWNRDLVPYAREIEDCVSFTHPSTDVVVKKSAQVGVSEIALNLFFSIAHANPCPVLIVLPTTDEVRKYNKLKLQPNIDATPAMRGAILEVKSRDADSSTASVKRFRGGYGIITGANSSVGLQMISARVIIFEEPSGYPADAGGRGDPIEQALARSKAWNERAPKRFHNGTPDLAGACRISARYEASDQRRFYVPCPHCGAYQLLRWDQGKSGLMWRADTPPHQAYYRCAAKNCTIESFERRAMVAAGLWIKTYRAEIVTADGEVIADPVNPPPPDIILAADIARWRARDSAGRQPGFAIWQAYSPFTSWDATVAEYLEAKKSGPAKLKVFTQQTLGEPWEERGEAPDFELLHARAQASRVPPRRVPLPALFLTAGADVQGDRLEWAVYAWSATLESWLIDKGVIEGDPETDAPWRGLAAALDRTYLDAWGKAWDIDALGVDAGYLSTRVYRWARAMTTTERDTRKVFALDGRSGWKLPPLGTPRPMDVDFAGKKIGSVLLWPVGTFDMKSEVYAALRATIAGAEGAGVLAPPLHLGGHCDKAYCEQLTAEHLVDDDSGGVRRKVWARIKSRRNEALDIAVYARALAHHFADSLSAADWRRLAQRRHGKPEDAQLDFAALWASASAAAPAAAAPEPAPSAPANAVRDDASPAAPADVARAEPRRGRRVIASPYLH